MIQLIDEENKSYKDQKVCYVCNLRYKTPKEIPVVFIMVLHLITTL